LVEIPFLAHDGEVMGCLVHRADDKVTMKGSKVTLSTVGEELLGSTLMRLL